jgi:hypothetical protein
LERPSQTGEQYDSSTDSLSRKVGPIEANVIDRETGYELTDTFDSLNKQSQNWTCQMSSLLTTINSMCGEIVVVINVKVSMTVGALRREYGNNNQSTRSSLDHLEAEMTQSAFARSPELPLQ